MILEIPAIEGLCSNSCFVILFGTTLYYWSKNLFAGEVVYTETGLLGYFGAVFLITLHLLLRWIDSGHFPLSNLYESLLFLSWCFLVLYIYIEKSSKTGFLGVLASPLLLCLVAFTGFSLPPELQKSAPLVPALQSNWLVMHVTVMIASYAALLLGCLVAIAYLVFFHFFSSEKNLSQPNFSLEISGSRTKNDPFDSEVNSSNSLIQGSTNMELVLVETVSPKNSIGTESFGKEKGKNQPNRLPTLLNFLDNLSYRTIGLGFCFLTLGILSGAVWANETWGNYWSWDPKETWALITWLTFATYLHSRLVGGWTGSKPAWIASLGFLIIWICYLGVNILGQGLHSYGFLQL